MIHLELEHLNIVKAILKNRVPDRAVWFFGSRITPNYKAHSDIDLCILGDEPLPLTVLAQLREDFSESDLPMRVDLVDWASTTPDFRAVILAQHYPFISI